MFIDILKQQKEKHNLMKLFLFFLFYISIYTLLDYFNGGYINMSENFGSYLTIINIGLNIVMSMLSALMMNISTFLVKLTGKEGKGTFFSSISIFFGMLTYGCTSCVIAFFATIGITFSVAILPLAGLPYKLVSLLIIILGFLWLKKEINQSRCKVVSKI